MIKRALGLGLVTLILGIGAYAYLYPGSQRLFSGSTTEVMSDDSDPSPLPHVYGEMLRSFDEHPSRLFYGAVAEDNGNPEHPAAAWIPFSERVIVLVLRGVVPIEQISTAIAFVLLILTGLSFYALARAWSFNPSVALGLSLAWAFCPFERARAKVHVGMVGTFHLPLIFLGLTLIARRRDRRSLLAAALCFWLASTAAHYFIVTAAALTPLFLIYAWVDRTQTPRVLIGRLLAAALPAVAWLAWGLTHPVPASVDLGGATALPQTGRATGFRRHPFLWTYAARPLDYLGGDIALAADAREWLPPRAWVNQRTLADLGYGNAHERTNGIRYLILALALVGLTRGGPRAWILGAFAFASFWLSLNPDWPAAGLGASGWLQSLVAQVRVPSRAGIGVHFGALLLAGLAISRAGSWLGWLRLFGILPLLITLEYPPFVTRVPIAPVRPAYANLNDSGRCGVGLLFPVVTDEVFPIIYYHFKQRVRGTGCTFVNAITRADVQAALLTKFPTSIDYVRTLDKNVTVVDRAVDLIRCARLNWVAFDEVTPARVRAEICGKLGWRAHADLTCASPAPAPPNWSLDRACL